MTSFWVFYFCFLFSAAFSPSSPFLFRIQGSFLFFPNVILSSLSLSFPWLPLPFLHARVTHSRVNQGLQVFLTCINTLGGFNFRLRTPTSAYMLFSYRILTLRKWNSRNHGLWGHRVWVWVLDLSLTSCVTFIQWINLSVHWQLDVGGSCWEDSLSKFCETLRTGCSARGRRSLPPSLCSTVLTFLLLL